ncbi:hypothetical protein WJX79_010692 [Trebouxia sp. C0005]
MLEVDFDDLDLGSKRKPTEWVAVLPVSAQQPRQRSSRQLLKAQKLQQAHKKQQEDKPQGAVKKQGIPVSTHAARMQQLAECTDVRQPRPISAEDAAAGAQAFPAENDEGNVEYKLRLKEPNCSPVRFQQLVTQMKYRLAEGNGECFYFIGVEDDGYPRGLTQTDMDISLATLRAMSEEVHAATTLLRKAAGTRKRQCAIVRVHKLCVDDVTYTDLRIAVAGSVDAGKSSLVGVLTHGIDGRPLLDNGCGSARMNVFQHKHEIETGRTSSLSQQMLGYDEEGKVLNYAGVSVLTPAEMSASARRVLRFIDLGGHEKYLKTALYGMTCMLPDYVLVCVCPLSGLSRVSHEHLAVALALEVPVACVITKADVAPPEAVEQVLQDVRRVIGAAAEVSQPKQSAVGADMEGGAGASQDAAPHVTHESQAVKLARQLGLTHFQVDHTFEVKGVGCVVSGTVVTGEVAVGQKLNLGPTGEGIFREVQVTCIHRSQVPVRHVMSGQHATVALHPCDVPLQPSQATQHFSHPSPVTSFAPPAINGSHTQFDASASTHGDQQRAAQLSLGGHATASKQHGALHQAGVGLIDATQPQVPVRGTQQQALPVGMMSQALNAQAQAVSDAPHQQQQDRWPPKPDTPDTVLSTSSLSESPLGASDSDADTTSPVRPGHLQADLAAGGRFGGLAGSESQGCSSIGRGCRYLDRPSKKRHSAVYTPVIHCGSVRQAAQVMSMEEVKSSDAVSPSITSSRIVEGCNLVSAVAAAVVMQDYTTGSSLLNTAQSGSSMLADGYMGDEASMCENSSGVGTLTRVMFKFQHRPEWLMEGSRVILRDRTDGCTAGAGVIRKLIPCI